MNSLFQNQTLRQKLIILVMVPLIGVLFFAAKLLLEKTQLSTDIWRAPGSWPTRSW